MSNKTKWQWIALISYIVGVFALIPGFMTKSWFWIALTPICYLVSLWCVAYKPVNGKKS